MEKRYKKALFIFRRDLRLHDNTALIAALQQSELVIPCFIFDPNQVEKNPYLSTNALQFMIAALTELASDLQKRKAYMYFFYGEPCGVVEELIKQERVDSVFVNRDYTPFSRKRDAQLEKLAKNNNVAFHSYFDLLLTEVGTVLTDKGTPYTVYSHFAKKAESLTVEKPTTNNYKNYYVKAIKREEPEALAKVLPSSDYNRNIWNAGGRKSALKILKGLGRFIDYDTERNIPEIDGTTGLSANNKFGTVSIREVYWGIVDKLGTSHTLIKQLYWRDFFSHVAFSFPHVFGHAFHKKYDGIIWQKDRELFSAWCKGQTGFPIVDAGMRQLNSTGFMHNRVRMIVASFLVKDLHLDWRWGEKYFAQKLVDYDPAVNNGNWQWAASTGCDAQPYFRIFNPWIQGKKFDPDCKYIKTWVEEIRMYDAKQIHKLGNGDSLPGYTPAIVDHSEAKKVAEDMFIEAAEIFAN